MENLFREIKAEAVRKGITMKDLAVRSDVSRPTLYRANFKLDVLQRIADELEVNASELIARAEK